MSKLVAVGKFFAYDRGMAETPRSPDPVSEAFRRVWRDAKARHEADNISAARAPRRPLWISKLKTAIGRLPRRRM